MKTTYYVGSTLDGFIAEADGGVKFLSLDGLEPDLGPYEEFFGTVDSTLMGRRTYDQILGFGDWPYGEKPCWVMTHGDIDPTATSISATRGTPGKVHSAIKNTGATHLWLVGGADLASQFLSAGLIDSVVVTVLPVVLGNGIPLFSGLAETTRLVHVETIERASGLVELRYTVGTIG